MWGPPHEWSRVIKTKLGEWELSFFPFSFMGRGDGHNTYAQFATWSPLCMHNTIAWGHVDQMILVEIHLDEVIVGVGGAGSNKKNGWDGCLKVHYNSARKQSDSAQLGPDRPGYSSINCKIRDSLWLKVSTSSPPIRVQIYILTWLGKVQFSKCAHPSSNLFQNFI